MTIKKNLNGDVILTASLLNPWDVEELYAAEALLCSDDRYYVDSTKKSQYTMTLTKTLKWRSKTWKELNDAFAELCDDGRRSK